MGNEITGFRIADLPANLKKLLEQADKNHNGVIEKSEAKEVAKGLSTPEKTYNEAEAWAYLQALSDQAQVQAKAVPGSTPPDKKNISAEEENKADENTKKQAGAKPYIAPSIITGYEFVSDENKETEHRFPLILGLDAGWKGLRLASDLRLMFNFPTLFADFPYPPVKGSSVDFSVDFLKLDYQLGHFNIGAGSVERPILQDPRALYGAASRGDNSLIGLGVQTDRLYFFNDKLSVAGYIQGSNNPYTVPLVGFGQQITNWQFTDWLINGGIKFGVIDDTLVIDLGGAKGRYSIPFDESTTGLASEVDNADFYTRIIYEKPELFNIGDHSFGLKATGSWELSNAYKPDAEHYFYSSRWGIGAGLKDSFKIGDLPAWASLGMGLNGSKNLKEPVPDYAGNLTSGENVAGNINYGLNAEFGIQPKTWLGLSLGYALGINNQYRSIMVPGDLFLGTQARYDILNDPAMINHALKFLVTITPDASKPLPWGKQNTK